VFDIELSVSAWWMLFRLVPLRYIAASAFVRLCKLTFSSGYVD
jgi:hypothetical protein